MKSAAASFSNAPLPQVPMAHRCSSVDSRNEALAHETVSVESVRVSDDL